MEIDLAEGTCSGTFDESGADEIVTDGKSAQRRGLELADSMVLEYVAFRGFSDSFRCFSREKKSEDARQDGGCYDAGFVLEALLGHVRELEVEGLLSGWAFLESRFFIRLDAELAEHAEALRCGLFRYFCVHAVRKGHPTKATNLLTEIARRQRRGSSTRRRRQSPEDDEMTPLWLPADSGSEETARRRSTNEEKDQRWWREWFALPHLEKPHLDPFFAVYFGAPWRASLVQSLRNFLATVFALAPPPKILLLEKWHRGEAQRALRSELGESRRRRETLQASLKEAETERDALADAVRDLLLHTHQSIIRSSSSAPSRVSLFDDDPEVSLESTRRAGAAAIDAAKLACHPRPPAPDVSLSDEEDEVEDAAHHAHFRSLAAATRAYIDHLKGTSTAQSLLSGGSSCSSTEQQQQLPG